MNIRKLHLLVAVPALLFALGGIAHAGCQDQGCSRPTSTGGCYTCGSAAGYACNLVGTCASDCNESACPAGGGGGDDPLITLAIPDLSIVPKTPAWELKDTLFATHFAPAHKPQQSRCQALVLPKNVLFTL